MPQARNADIPQTTGRADEREKKAIGRQTTILNDFQRLIFLIHFNTFVKTIKMRLSKSEIKNIKSVARDVWGDTTIIYLFGSRIDDSKKGGDIDLYIQLSQKIEPKNIMLQKAEFLGRLEILLGEQKIDLLVRTPYNKHLPIFKSAQLMGVAL